MKLAYRSARCVAKQDLVFFGRFGASLRNTNRGLSLVELLISIGLGVFVLLGLMSFVGTSNRNFVATTSLARMQETGRLAVDLLGNEVRRSGFWAGINYDKSLTEVVGGSLPPFEGTQATCAQLLQDRRFSRLLDQNLHGINNSNAGYGCLMPNRGAGRYLRGDFFTVRYASSDGVSTLTDNEVFMRIAPFEGRMFLGDQRNNAENQVFDPVARVHRVNANAYYVGDSGRVCAGEPIPSLFRIGLTDQGTTRPVVQELLPGVEQLQIQYLEGTRYRNGGQVGNYDNVSAVQLWVLVRSECPEHDLESLQASVQAYEMGDQTYQPNSVQDRRYRRKLFRQVFTRRNRVDG